MKTKTNGLIIVGAVLFLLWALFHLAIGVYHTLLFATQGSQSLFSAAYGIQVECGRDARSGTLAGQRRD